MSTASTPTPVPEVTKTMSPLCPTLPTEVWLKILTHVPSSSLHNISQVNHTLHQIATSESLFQNYHRRNHTPIPQLSSVPSWREIHHRTLRIRSSPTYECYTSPTRIQPITHVGDTLLVHIPAHNTLHAFPHSWSLDLGFLRGDPRAVAPLQDSRCVLVDSANPDVGNPRLHVVDVEKGSVASYELPRHFYQLSKLPGRKELLLPAENFGSVIYYAGVLRVVNLSDFSTRDLPYSEVLLLGESPRPLIEGYTLFAEDSIVVHSLSGQVFTNLPKLPEGDKLLTLATNKDFNSFTARIQRSHAVVAWTRCNGLDFWTHLNNARNAQGFVKMFYNGERTLILPGHHSPRMTVIQTGSLEGLHTIRAARVHGAPFDWGAISLGGDVVILCARRIGVVSLFDINTGACIRSVRFFRGRVDGVALIGGAWIVAWRSRGACVFEAWRFGKVGQLFGSVNQVLHNLGRDDSNIYDVQSSIE